MPCWWGAIRCHAQHTTSSHRASLPPEWRLKLPLWSLTRRRGYGCRAVKPRVVGAVRNSYPNSPQLMVTICRPRQTRYTLGNSVAYQQRSNVTTAWNGPRSRLSGANRNPS